MKWNIITCSCTPVCYTQAKRSSEKGRGEWEGGVGRGREERRGCGGGGVRVKITYSLL